MRPRTALQLDDLVENEHYWLRWRNGSAGWEEEVIFAGFDARGRGRLFLVFRQLDRQTLLELPAQWIQSIRHIDGC